MIKKGERRKCYITDATIIKSMKKYFIGIKKNALTETKLRKLSYASKREIFKNDEQNFDENDSNNLDIFN